MGDAERPPGSLALLTRLAKLVYRRSPEDELGMTLRHFVTLSYLRDHPGAAQQDLGDVFCIDASNLVLLLNELEAADLAERRRDAGDRRRHLVRLTPTGEEALARADQAQERIEAEILHMLSPQERATLRELLARALAEFEPGTTASAASAPSASAASASASAASTSASVASAS